MMWSRKAANKGNIHVILLPRWTGMLHFVRLSIAFAVIGLASTAAPISGGFAAFFLAIFEVGSSLVPLTTTEMLG